MQHQQNLTHKHALFFFCTEGMTDCSVWTCSIACNHVSECYTHVPCAHMAFDLRQISDRHTGVHTGQMTQVHTVHLYTAHTAMFAQALMLSESSFGCLLLQGLNFWPGSSNGENKSHHMLRVWAHLIVFKGRKVCVFAMYRTYSISWTWAEICTTNKTHFKASGKSRYLL